MAEDIIFKSRVVEEILMKRPENAVRLLGQHYNVEAPGLQVGVVKGHSTKVLGIYVSRKKTIFVRSREVLYDPFVILHEFYHHLRTRAKEHRGTERHADRFAKDFIEAHLTVKEGLS